MRSIMNHPFKVYRLKSGKSQQELADLLGVSRQLVGLIETGARRVNANNARQWEALTGIPRAELCPDVFGDAREAA